MIKGVKLNKKGEAVIYLDVFPQTDELKDAVKEVPSSPPRPGFRPAMRWHLLTAMDQSGVD